MMAEMSDFSEIAVIGLSADKRFLTVGGRKEHRILKVVKDEAGKYSSLQLACKVFKQKDNLEKSVFDV